jgi:GTP cyclohydrolase FolE2
MESNFIDLPDLMLSAFKGLGIPKVGVRNVVLPMTVYSQDTVARCSIYHSLSGDARGSHMSWLLKALQNAMNYNLPTEQIFNSIGYLKDGLESEEQTPSKIFVKFAFPFFERKTAPISGELSYLKADVITEGKYNAETGIEYYTTLTIPYTSLCPCSKEISKYGAHNQRSTLTLTVVGEQIKSFYHFFDLVDEVASAPIYEVLHRPDEKYVTEQAYENPMFVEDVARKVKEKVEKWENIEGFVAVVNHFESIHNHDAVAVIRGGEKFLL